MRLLTILACALLAGAPSARAEVVDSAPGGFSVKAVVDVAAPAASVYRTLVDRVGAWWDSSHSFSGNAINLSIDERPGGCFCEKLPSGGGVRHMTVVYAEPGKLLRMSGGLGPLQGLAVAGSMSWTLKESNGKTTIELAYGVGGYMPGGLEQLAKPVDGVLTAQLQRLKQFVESTR